MPDTTTGVRFFKPSGETVFLPEDQMVGFGPHDEWGGMVVRTVDDKIIHTNLPWMVVTEPPSEDEKEGTSDPRETAGVS